MSVLYKALQKAEKENELRQSATSDSNFDPQRLAASGALKFAGGRGQAMNRFVMGGVGLVAIAVGVAFVLFQDDLTGSGPSAAPGVPPSVTAAPPEAVVAQAEQPQVLPGAPESSPPTASRSQSEGTESPAAPATGASAGDDTAAGKGVVAEASPEKTEALAEAASGSDTGTGEKQAVSTARQTSAPAKVTARPTMQRPEPMPAIAPNSPARMLSPPISVNRTEFELGVGNQVQVRQVADSARNKASAGYDALVRGSYDAALAFYDDALKEEPNSVLAVLGRATSLQKLGRGAEAQAAYDQVLKMDPANREALTNLTSILAERSPQEAISRLVELEREYPAFSPIKAQLGLIYAKTGSMQQALDYLGRAVALAPETVMYHYNLALVLDHLGRKEQAVASYDRVLSSIAGGRGPAELSASDIERRVQFLRAR